jgi:hypothetical protein
VTNFEASVAGKRTDNFFKISKIFCRVLKSAQQQKQSEGQVIKMYEYAHEELEMDLRSCTWFIVPLLLMKA